MDKVLVGKPRGKPRLLQDLPTAVSFFGFEKSRFVKVPRHVLSFSRCSPVNLEKALRLFMYIFPYLVMDPGASRVEAFSMKSTCIFLRRDAEMTCSSRFILESSCSPLYVSSIIICVGTRLTALTLVLSTLCRTPPPPGSAPVRISKQGETTYFL